MTNNTDTIITEEATSALARIAHSVLVAYAWVSGPAKTEEQRIQAELEKAHVLEMELESTSIVI